MGASSHVILSSPPFPANFCSRFAPRGDKRRLANSKSSRSCTIINLDDNTSSRSDPHPLPNRLEGKIQDCSEGLQENVGGATGPRTTCANTWNFGTTTWQPWDGYGSNFGHMERPIRRLQPPGVPIEQGEDRLELLGRQSDWGWLRKQFPNSNGAGGGTLKTKKISAV